MSRENMHTIKRPYINFNKTIRFHFQEYNSNIKLQCVHWHRLIRACINVYGYFDFLKHIRCIEAVEYFKQCIQLNSFFAYHKKYFPQEYYHSEYWRVSPHYDNVFVDSDWMWMWELALHNSLFWKLISPPEPMRLLNMKQVVAT